jgi:hypothetical protein
MRSLHRAALRRFFVGLAVLPLGACEWPTSPRTGEYRGIYVSAFEASSFRACPSRAGWWWLSGELGPIFDALPPRAGPELSLAGYIRVRGVRSKHGQYGHLGSYPYELVVREVLEVSADTAGKCS